MPLRIEQLALIEATKFLSVQLIHSSSITLLEKGERIKVFKNFTLLEMLRSSQSHTTKGNLKRQKSEALAILCLVLS